jgi:D-alanyl-D-alanine carboxypeptidase
MRFLFLILLVALCAAWPARSSGAGAPDAEQRLARLVPAKARWSLVVLDGESGQEIAVLGQGADLPMVPGSLMKLFVTGAVLSAAEKGESLLPASLPANRRKAGRVRTESERLQRLLREMNVHSNNRLADRFFMRLGKERSGGPATLEKGQQAIGEFLVGLGLPPGEVTIADGSGLSGENRVSARFLARYLHAVSRRPWQQRFRETLPRPGLEGTVRDIGYVDRRFRVKSGQLDNAFALAGYGVDQAGRPLAFAYLVNGPEPLRDLKKSRGAVVRLLAEHDLHTGAAVSR